MKYIAICDFDGTIADQTGKITPNTIEMIREFTKNNILYILSYDRFERIYQLITQSDIDVRFISLSDSICYSNKKIIRNYINHEIVNSIIKDFEKDIYTLYTNHQDTTYIYNFQERLNLLYPNEKKIVIDRLEIDTSSFTIAVSVNSTEKLKEIILRNNLFYEVYGKDTHREMINISAIPNNKEDLCIKILEKYDLPSIGIGDDISDYKYIKHCNIKIAMLNSNDDLKAKCDITSKYDNTMDGCLIELLRLNNS